MTTSGTVLPVRIDEEMRTSYLSYAMSVIVSRALPDVRDGLKPVQRRILYAMDEIGSRPGTAYKKCARIVGEVLGKYHPHGDASVYDALVRMAQDFSMRYPLVDGQGNFGSVDDDPPASMRYTEARLASISEELLADLDLNTVDLATNFDDTLTEPTVLPARLPNMLINGASGIAVGMATNIPPHNLTEICDAIAHLIDHPEATTQALMAFVPGPDFPTAGIIRGHSGIISAYETGQGRIVVEANATIEEMRGNREQIIITELPYQVNKATLVEKIAGLMRERRVDGISDIRDESDRQGLRVVVELRRDANARVVLNNLYRHTQLRTAFHVMLLAQVDGQPQVLGLRRSLQLFIEHRQRVIVRRTEFLLQKAKDRAHIVEGLRLALDRLDEVIAIIRASQDVETARQNLMDDLTLTEVQAQAILDMQLRRLAALERERLENEYQELQKTIAEHEALLADPAKVLAAVKTETQALRRKFGDKRRTYISEEETTELGREDYIHHAEMVMTLSQRGYIKRIPAETYKRQHRGGKGVRGMSTRDDDSLQELLVADTHDTVLFFTNRGRAYPLRCFDIAEDSSRTTRGTPIINLLPIGNGERVNAVLAVPDLRERGNVFVLATRRGQVKMLRPGDLAGIRTKGLIVMNLREGDEVVSARVVKEGGDVILVTEMGQSIRFGVSEVRQTGRQSGGVGGMKLAKGDQVVAMDVALQNGFLLTASRNGYGKCTNLAYYRQQGRNGLGVRTFRVSEMTGRVVAARVVTDTDDQEIMLISAKAQVIRVSLQDFRVVGRNTQGVRIWRDKVEDDYVASLTCMAPQDRSDDALVDGEDPVAPTAEAEVPVAAGAGSRNGASAELEEVDDDGEDSSEE